MNKTISKIRKSFKTWIGYENNPEQLFEQRVRNIVGRNSSRKYDVIKVYAENTNVNRYNECVGNSRYISSNGGNEMITEENVCGSPKNSYYFAAFYVESNEDYIKRIGEHSVTIGEPNSNVFELERLFENRIISLIGDTKRRWCVRRVYGSTFGRHHMEQQVGISMKIASLYDLITEENTVGGKNPYHFVAYFIDSLVEQGMEDDFGSTIEIESLKREEFVK